MRGEAGGARGRGAPRGSSYPAISSAYWLPPSNPTPYHVPDVHATSQLEPTWFRSELQIIFVFSHLDIEGACSGRARRPRHIGRHFTPAKRLCSHGSVHSCNTPATRFTASNVFSAQLMRRSLSPPKSVGAKAAEPGMIILEAFPIIHFAQKRFLIASRWRYGLQRSQRSCGLYRTDHGTSLRPARARTTFASSSTVLLIDGQSPLYSRSPRHAPNIFESSLYYGVTLHPKMLSPTNSNSSQPNMLSHTNSNSSQSLQLSPTKSLTSQPKMLSHANSNTSQSPQLSPTTSLTSQQKILSHSMPNTSQSKMLSPTNINSSQSPQLSHTTSNTSQPEKLSPTKLNSPQSQHLSPPIPTTSQNCTVNNNNGDKPCYQINSLNKKISLPHVYLKTSHADEKLCFLIDTGASVSLVKHARLQKPPPIDGSVIHIKGINSSENYSETLGSLQLHIEHPFPNNTTLSFDYKFHAVLSDINLDCDGIIGNDLLQSLDADVQYSTNTLLIQGYSLPIHFTQPVYIIPSRSIAIVECAVSNDESELSNCKVALIVDHTVSEGVYVSNCLATLKSNKRVNVSILNTTESDVKIIDYRVHLTPIDFNLEDAESTSESINKITLSNSSRSQQVLNNIRTSHLNEQEKKALLNCCSEFTDIFYLEGEPLSYTSAIKHSINTGDSPPIHVKSYRFPECHKEEVGKQIQKMLDQNIIIPSNSPWSAPVWVVPKKLDASGKRKWRVVVDYRKLNDVTVSEVYPLPLINDILDQLGHSKYFSTLDLASGFHQIAMDPQDADKTGFSVITNGSTSGHYQFTRMPFGLKNAPSTFQRLMNTALSGLQGLHCLVFLDDVIIYSHDLESHMQKLNLVFDKLRHFNLKLQPDKCEFLRREVAYLGHVITDKGVSPNPEKVKAVSEFPVPKNPKDVKSFLGLAGYYRRFIENFSKITKPLTSLLKKDACFHWSQEQQEAFNLLKDKLTSAPLLQYPNFEIPFVLTTDASNYAVSAILSQGDIGKDKPIAYASRTLNKQEAKMLQEA
ncbi:unnamed protein product [Plutella xylostella]|uniref:(diamondback moth) hypothetical protein n=1 Tax=Plutella xylostella TaxID=51655 RepID=A0A8S4ETY9_PLUXY|nr:unnamed protein product [Plutella xylostella]